MSNLPNNEILEEAWKIIKHLSTGPGPCTPVVSHDCRQLVLRHQMATEQPPVATINTVQPNLPEKQTPLIQMLAGIPPEHHTEFFAEAERIKNERGFHNMSPLACPSEFKHTFLAYGKFGGTKTFFELGITPH
jgi:hypothetical protein